jgi:hypothetical protein
VGRILFIYWVPFLTGGIGSFNGARYPQSKIVRPVVSERMNIVFALIEPVRFGFESKNGTIYFTNATAVDI